MQSTSRIEPLCAEKFFASVELDKMYSLLIVLHWTVASTHFQFCFSEPIVCVVAVNQ